jgi:phosphate transport system ATP-binding protein
MHQNAAQLACEPAPTAPERTSDVAVAEPLVTVRGLTAGYGQRAILQGIDVDLPQGGVTAVIGPSGCGKSTFIRCLNRLHETVHGARVSGQVLLAGTDIYRMDPVDLRRRIGMVFQRPNPFPGRSIFDNIALALRLSGIRKRSVLRDKVEQSLRLAALWDEVKDRLHQPAEALSGGQQQRLCIARALALDPEVLLMDEPTSALDPVSTQRVEALIETLRARCTVVLVTHNLAQAARVSDRTVFLLDGRVVEQGETAQVFERPADPRTAAYLAGRDA